MTFWSFFFGWYQGAVYSNLLASAICTGLAATVTVWRVRVHHERTRAENAAHREAVESAVAGLHARLDQHQGGAE